MRRVSMNRAARSQRGDTTATPLRRIRVALLCVRAAVRIARYRWLSKLTAAETSQMRALYVHESPLLHANAVASILRAVGIACTADLAELILRQGTQHREGEQLKWRCFERLVMALKHNTKNPSAKSNSREGEIAFSALGPDREGFVTKETVASTLKAFDLNAVAFPELTGERETHNRRPSDALGLDPTAHGGMCFEEFEQLFLDLPPQHDNVRTSISTMVATEAPPHHAATGVPATMEGVALEHLDDAERSFLMEAGSSFRPHAPTAVDPLTSSNGFGDVLRSARQWMECTPRHFQERRPELNGTTTESTPLYKSSVPRPPLSTPRTLPPMTPTPRVAKAFAFQSSSKRFFETIPLEALPSPRGPANPQPIRPPEPPKQRSHKRKRNRNAKSFSSRDRLTSFSATQ